MEQWHPRRENRLTTILLVGRIMTASGDYICRIRNLSSGGMMIECDVALKPKDRVAVELRNGRYVEGVVMWAEAPRAGVMFDAPIAVDQLLHPPGVTDGQRPRAPRLSADCPALLWHDGRTEVAQLRDLSQSGCRLIMAKPLMTEGDARITIPGLPARHATLRWTDGEAAGFGFHEMLSYVELAQWQLQAHHRFAEAR